jgi:ubiquinone/menaquinone biosynthesis C-methylase UbiE
MLPRRCDRAKECAMTQPSHIDRIRAQFTKQWEVYARLKQTNDPKPLAGLVRISGVVPGQRVLDVACGPGFLTRAFARSGAQVIGIDATDAFLELARAEARDEGLGTVEFRAGDAERLPFDDGTFDVVVCRAAFHHFPRPERVLGEMRRVCRPGGRVMVGDMIGNDDPARAAYHDRIERLCDPTHVRAIPAAELEQLFADAGLRIVAAPCSTMDYDADEWIAHGGPDADTTRDILTLLEDAIDGDRAGLHVRREDGKLRFTHQTALFIGERPA